MIWVEGVALAPAVGACGMWMEEKGWTATATQYAILAEKFGKAGDCVGCGQCEGVCPQHLPIIEKLKEVSGHFDR